MKNRSPTIFIYMQGIYKIINIDTGKYYVGSSKTIVKRWGEHRLDLTRKVHDNEHLQSAWNLYGESKFKFVVVEQLPNITYSELLANEQRHLDAAKLEKSMVYNMKFTAAGWDWSDGKLLESLPRGARHKDYCADIFNFININTLEKFSGTRCELYTKHNFQHLKHHVRALVNGKRKSVMGWILDK